MIIKLNNKLEEINIKIKKSDLRSLILVLAILIALIAVLPVLMNLKKIMGIGHYTVQDTETIEYDNGQANAVFTMNIDYMEGWINQEYMAANYFRISYKVQVSADGNVQNIGIDLINYSVFYNSESGIFMEESVALDGAKSYSGTLFRQLTKDDKVIFTGQLGISYTVEGEAKEEIIPFEIIHVQPVDPGMYEYSFDLPLIWLNLVYFVLLGVVIIWLARVVWKIRFHSRYTEEDRMKDEYFHGYIKKLAEEKNAENSS